MPRISIMAWALGLSLCGCGVYGSGPQTAPPPRATTVSLTAAQIDMIRAYYGETGPGRGHGRSGGLPPGIEKNLQRGKPLPPGIAKQYLPRDLLLRLPHAPDGLEYVIVAGKLLLVEIATQIVRQVLLETVFG